MKKLLLCIMMIPSAGNGGFTSLFLHNDKPVEIRTGVWPITLEKSIGHSDTTYLLQFRDVQVMSSIVMDTLSFANQSQLKYFEKALTALKTGSNGDIARFKDYSIKRADKKYEGAWYMLQIKWGLTNFSQPEADLMIKTIKELKF